MQKEVLPKLLQLFPGIQFIISSHSPFLSMGLAEKASSRSRVIDVDNLGISTDPTSNDLYTEVYEMMIHENDRFKERYTELDKATKSGTKPLIITEGKTDIQYLKAAMAKLDDSDIDIDFYEITEDWGDSQLLTLLEWLSRIPQSRKIIGIFDRDVQKVIDVIEKDDITHKDYGNNVYAFCVPLVNSDVYKTELISTEHYFPRKVLLKVDANGRRLFLGEEFYESQKSIEGLYSTSMPAGQLKNKIEVNSIIDGEVYKSDDLKNETNLARSKADFASSVEDGTENLIAEDFASFSLIFSKIKKIADPETITEEVTSKA